MTPRIAARDLSTHPHAQHYVDQSKGQHDAIVRLREENAALKARIAEFEQEKAA